MDKRTQFIISLYLLSVPVRYRSRTPSPRSCYSQESFCKLEGVIFWEAGEIPARPRHCKRGGPIQNATVHQDGKADRTADA